MELVNINTVSCTYHEILKGVHVSNSILYLCVKSNSDISNKSYHDPRTESGAKSSHDDASNDLLQ